MKFVCFSSNYDMIIKCTIRKRMCLFFRECMLIKLSCFEYFLRKFVDDYKDYYCIMSKLSARYKFIASSSLILELIELLKQTRALQRARESKNSMTKRHFNLYTTIYVEIMTLFSLLEESRLETQTLL